MLEGILQGVSDSEYLMDSGSSQLDPSYCMFFIIFSHQSQRGNNC